MPAIFAQLKPPSSYQSAHVVMPTFCLLFGCGPSYLHPYPSFLALLSPHCVPFLAAAGKGKGTTWPSCFILLGRCHGLGSLGSQVDLLVLELLGAVGTTRCDVINTAVWCMGTRVHCALSSLVLLRHVPSATNFPSEVDRLLGSFVSERHKSDAACLTFGRIVMWGLRNSGRFYSGRKGCKLG